MIPKNTILKLFSLLLILSTNLIYAQMGGLRGFIRDSLTGEKVPFATVQIKSLKKGTNSDANAFYFITNIPLGSYDVEVSAIGYFPSIRKVEIKKGREQLSQNLYIAPQPVELAGVTKTADRMSVYETNISAQIISQAELKIIPITIEKDILRAIKIIPGISSTSDVTSQLYVRGGGGDQNLIILDNMIIYNPFHAFGLFSTFNSDIIKTIEVLTGGFGPEYGGRLSSVINIITKEGNRNNYAGRVNLGLLSGQAYVEGPIYDGSFLLSFRKSYFDRMLKRFLNKDIPVDFYDLNAKLSYDVSDNAKMYVNFFMSDDKLESKLLSEPNYSWKNNAIGVEYLQSMGELFMFNCSFSRSYFHAYMDPKALSNTSRSETKIENAFFNAKVDAFLDNNDILSIGFTFDIPITNYSFTNNAGYYVYRDGSIADASIWMKYKLINYYGFTTDFGIRTNLIAIMDYPEYSLEPRVMLKYNINDNFAIKGSIGRYHQKIATINNEDEVIPLFETWFPVELPFKPQRADHYILGIDGDLFENLRFSSQIYYKKYINLLGYNLNKIDADDPDLSAGTGSAFGIENIIKLHIKRFYLWATYSLSKAEKTMNAISYAPRYDKRHSVNLLTGYSFPNDFNLSFNWEFSSGAPFTQIIGYMDRETYDDIFNNGGVVSEGSYFAIFGDKNSARLPNYHRLDVTLSKLFYISDIAKINVDLSIVNLYDAKNIFYYNRESGEKINMLPFMPSITIGVEF